MGPISTSNIIGFSYFFFFGTITDHILTILPHLCLTLAPLTKKQSMMHTATLLSITDRKRVRNQPREIMARISSLYLSSWNNSGRCFSVSLSNTSVCVCVCVCVWGGGGGGGGMCTLCRTKWNVNQQRTNNNIILIIIIIILIIIIIIIHDRKYNQLQC